MILYDQALSTYVQNNLATKIVGKTLQIVFATPKRAFADVATGRLLSNDTLTLPRVAITRMGNVNDPKRFNSNRLRFLGREAAARLHKLRSATFPAPIAITYQVDLWAKYVKEMNLLEEQVLFDFAPQYRYLSIVPDAVYTTKMYPVFLESGISDASELEPSTDDRAIRKTFQLRAECWLFDQSFIGKYVVKRIQAQFRDYDTDALMDTMYLPPIETLGTGNGVTRTFNFTLTRPPVLIHSIVINAICGGSSVIIIDDNTNNLVIGSSGTAVGTINLNSGVVSVTFPTAPDNATAITATYFHNIT